jgi:predicted GIY-YIG superfamily endonuclease
MGRPWKIVYAEVVANKSIAASRESQIKRLSKTAKLDLLIEHQSALALADMELN